MKLKETKICIIVLNWNGLADTERCLNSLLKIKVPKFNVIVVDNGSKNNEADTLKKKYGSKIDVHPLSKNFGFTGGVNYGLKFAKKKYNPSYYLLLNNDVVVENTFLLEMLKTANSDNNIGIVSPIIYDLENKNKILYSGGKINWLFARPVHNKDYINETRTQTFVTGCCYLIKDKLFNKNGILDNRFFAYFEDAAYCLSAIRAGFKCVVEPKAVIYHKESSSMGKKSARYTYLFSRNRILFINNYTNPIYKLYFFVFNFLKLIAVEIYFILTGQGKRFAAFLRGYIDGNLQRGGEPRV